MPQEQGLQDLPDPSLKFQGLLAEVQGLVLLWDRSA